MQVIGHLGKDAVLNSFSGKTVLNFTVAHTEKRRDTSGNQVDKTIWVDCAYWTERTGIAPYLKKGTQLHADVSPEVKTYQKKDGSQGFLLTLRISSINLLGNKQDGQTQAVPSVQQASTINSTHHTDAPVDTWVDDLPF